MTGKVSVPAASDMADRVFALHIALRHADLRRTFRATRAEHDTVHRCLPAGLLDHEHRPAVEPEEDAAEEARSSFWFGSAPIARSVRS